MWGISSLWGVVQEVSEAYLTSFTCVTIVANCFGYLTKILGVLSHNLKHSLNCDQLLLHGPPVQKNVQGKMT